MIQYRLADHSVVTEGVSFSANGRAYQSNFLNLATDEDLAAQGITREEVADPPPLTPPTVSDRQFYQALAAQGLITQDEALAAVSIGAIPAALETFIGTLPQEQQFAARMLLSGATTFDRSHPMTALLAQGMGWTQEQVGALWLTAFKL